MFLSSLSTTLHQHSEPKSLGNAYPATVPNEPAFDKPGGARDWCCAPQCCARHLPVWWGRSRILRVLRRKQWVEDFRYVALATEGIYE